MALLAICIGFFVIQIDATVVNVALPSIGKSIGGSLSKLQWVVDAYTLALAGLMLTAGSVADRLGARRAFLIGICLFTVGSAGCAAAPGLPALIAARALQGIGAAALLPCSLALIVHAYPDQHARARALGMWGAMGSIGMAAGPALGGLLIASVGWRAIFLINVPIGLVELWLLTRYVTESPRHHSGPVDVKGAILSVLALSALAAAFIEAGPQGWLGSVPTTLFALGVVFGVCFVVTERRQAHSMVPLGLFKERTFSVAVGVGFAFNLSLYGALLCLSIYLQQSRGQSALSTGLLLLPMAVLVAAGSILSGRLTSRVGHRIPMVTGFLIAGAGACLFTTVTRHTSLVLLVVGTLLLGLCSIAMPAMSSLAVSTVPPERAGVASGVFNTARQAGGALGVAVLGSLLGAGVGAASSKSMSLAHPMIVAAVALIGGAVVSFLGTKERQHSPD